MFPLFGEYTLLFISGDNIYNSEKNSHKKKNKSFFIIIINNNLIIEIVYIHYTNKYKL